jgi:hypothetical protein
MPRVLYVVAVFLAAISVSVDSFAQVATCSVRRQVISEVWRVSESGEIVDHVEEGLVNYDPGEFSFTAEAVVAGAGCSASHGMNWVYGDSAVVATGIHSLEISQSEEGIHRWFTTKVIVDGHFTAISNFELSYSGVASGGEVHVLQVERDDGFAFEKRFPFNGGEFSYTRPVLEAGEYEFSIALIDNYNGSDACIRTASSDFMFSIKPAEDVGVGNGEWGMVKAIYR